MVSLNSHYRNLDAGYLFLEIAKRTRAFQDAHSGVQVYRLGIGNTTEPLTPHVIEGLKRGVDKLAFVETYKGYGDEQGEDELRKAIADTYKERGVVIDPLEVFVSDGAKCDSANIQSIFAVNGTRVAVQDPAYPVYVDTNVIAGRAGKMIPNTGKYVGLVYMPCTEENNFIPDFPVDPFDRPIGDLIYLCSPNNPTGAVMDRKSLEKFVDYARQNKSVIIFDAAYNWFIKDPELPRSIYEIDGAEECAIEINSFSKYAGFTGVRLGWSVVPKDLVTDDGEPGLANKFWNRRQTTMFNGASNIAQAGGLVALSPQGREESQKLIDYYMRNAQIIRSGLEKLGIKVYGGENAPYVWIKNPNEIKSWDFFDKVLNEAHVVTTPGVGFGPSGEGFTRLSAFGHRENITGAVESIVKNLNL